MRKNLQSLTLLSIKPSQNLSLKLLYKPLTNTNTLVFIRNIKL